MKYEGKWIDCFCFEIYEGKEHPHMNGKILFRTPSIDYVLNKEQFKEFKRKVNEVEL